jgi:hypothetical protein
MGGQGLVNRVLQGGGLLALVSSATLMGPPERLPATN